MYVDRSNVSVNVPAEPTNVTTSSSVALTHSQRSPPFSASFKTSKSVMVAGPGPNGLTETTLLAIVRDRLLNGLKVAGWKAACDTCGVAWGGGETPALAGIVESGRIDLAASCTGLVNPKPAKQDNVITIRPPSIRRG